MIVIRTKDTDWHIMDGERLRGLCGWKPDSGRRVYLEDMTTRRGRVCRDCIVKSEREQPNEQK